MPGHGAHGVLTSAASGRGLPFSMAGAIRSWSSDRRSARTCPCRPVSRCGVRPLTRSPCLSTGGSGSWPREGSTRGGRSAAEDGGWWDQAETTKNSGGCLDGRQPASSEQCSMETNRLPAIYALPPKGSWTTWPRFVRQPPPKREGPSCCSSTNLPQMRCSSLGAGHPVAAPHDRRGARDGVRHQPHIATPTCPRPRRLRRTGLGPHQHTGPAGQRHHGKVRQGNQRLHALVTAPLDVACGRRAWTCFISPLTLSPALRRAVSALWTRLHAAAPPRCAPTGLLEQRLVASRALLGQRNLPLTSSSRVVIVLTAHLRHRSRVHQLRPGTRTPGTPQDRYGPHLSRPEPTEEQPGWELAFGRRALCPVQQELLQVAGTWPLRTAPIRQDHRLAGGIATIRTLAAMPSALNCPERRGSGCPGLAAEAVAAAEGSCAPGTARSKSALGTRDWSLPHWFGTAHFLYATRSRPVSPRICPSLSANRHGLVPRSGPRGDPVARGWAARQNGSVWSSDPLDSRGASGRCGSGRGGS